MFGQHACGVSSRSASMECPDGASVRFFLCGRCRAQVLICRSCGRGQIYCAAGCAQDARREAQRAAGRRYQTSDRGRASHASRARRYRARQKSVTHHGSPHARGSGPAATASLGRSSVASRSTWGCHGCGRRCSPFVRLGFLRRRRPFRTIVRRHGRHPP
jgi:hypothetical protein